MGDNRYLIGVDGGTESLRAGVFDLSGRPLAFASSPYKTTFPRPGWAEQNPDDWWQALGSAVKQAVTDSGVPLNEIAAISLDTTNCTVVALDGDGHALRPALLWMDMRSAAQAAQVAATKDIALQVNSDGAGPVSAEWMVPKALWISQQEPEIYHNATYICEYQDYMNYHLTGRMCASISNVSVRWHYNCTRGWPISLLEKLGLESLVDKWPQDVLPLGATVGQLTASAAVHLGLPEGLLVAQGGSDAFIGMVGLGVVTAGQMAMLTGSSHLQLGMCAEPLHGPGIFGTYPDAVIPGLHVIEGGQTSTGSIINWMRHSLVGQQGWPGFENLNTAAAQIPPGSEGLLCCDHFQGNRTPYTDAASRGGLFGLTLKHTQAHVFRAIMEGVAFGTELILENMRDGGYHPESLTLAGGATKSDLWLHIHADVSNLPLRLTEVSDAPALGCAILAAVAAGLYPDITAAVSAMVQVSRVVQPDPHRHEEYARFYRGYKALYPALKTVRQALEDQPLPPQQQHHPAPTAAQADSHKPQQQQQQQCSNGSLLPAIIAPSILAADFADLASEVAAIEKGGADWVHVDMFDGTFAPNFTIGPPVVSALRKHTSMFLDCHLAVLDPSKYVSALQAAGANSITFQIEPFLLTSAANGAAGAAAAKEAAAALAAANAAAGPAAAAEAAAGPAAATDAAAGSAAATDAAPRSAAANRNQGPAAATAAAAALASDIRSRGMRAGVALAVGTTVEAVLQLVQQGAVDMVLCMTVECGFGGQRFQPQVLEKVKQLRSSFPSLNVQVNGGINPETARLAAAAGANVLVAGSAVLGCPSGPAAAIRELRKALLHESLSTPVLADALASVTEAVC